MRITLILLFLLNFLFADSDHHKEKDHYYSKDLTYLSLSSSQEEQVKKILKNYRKELKRYRHFKKEQIEKKQKLFLENTYDANKLEQINQTINQEETRIERELMQHLHDILSSEQKKKFTHYIREWEIE